MCLRIAVFLLLLTNFATPVFAQGEVVSVTNLYETVENYIGTAASLSPDGTQVAFSTRIEQAGQRIRSLCIYTIEDKGTTCTAFPEDTQVARTDRLAWSPDSRHLAMTEDFLSRLDEPDVWIFDLETQRFSNLTDDGVQGNLSEETGGLIDYFPIWHPVTGDLYFQRMQESDQGPVNSLQRVRAGSLKVEQVAILPEYFFEGVVPAAPAISPEGTRIAVILKNPEADYVYGGLYIIDLESGTSEQVLGLENLATGTYVDLDAEASAGLWRLFPAALAWTGEDTLLMGRSAFTYEIMPAALIYNHIDLVSGTATPIIDLSEYDTRALFEVNASLQISYGAYYPFYALLGAENRTLYYASRADFSSRQLLLSLPIPPDGSNLPRLEIEADFPPLPGMPQYDFLPQVSDNGRYGLLMGYYLIEFATEGGN